MRVLQDLMFGQPGSDRPHLGAGWSDDEPGYRWMLGQASELQAYSGSG